MKTRSYSVVGDKKQGHRIAVPECANPEKGDRYVARVRGEMPGVPLVSVDEGVRVLR